MIILTSPCNLGIRLTGERQALSLEGRSREYAQVRMATPHPYWFHIGWVRVEDLANALDGGSTP